MSIEHDTEENIPVVSPLDKDFTLGNLSRMANAGLIIGITLTVGGNIVSGNMISGKEYMESIADTLENINEQGDTLATLYRSYSSNIYDGSDESERVEFVHLKDAIIFQGTVRHQVGLWRGRINAVDGYSFGCMG
ncbi:gas vesicle accessory protein GvpU [Paenibacillus dokdonensis]|uniref:gas vesicle accessory protein GvpU n=1 Tax=Paenibacillus dokdonensis TaxID=2567944 RepID=UPI0010A8EFE7|nr:gas vesicle accessory protein GvpU [Paenibacillus dokdonensis]